MPDSCDFASPRGQAAGSAFAGFVRATAATLVVVLPLVVTPWGEAAYSYVKSEVTIAFALAAVVGWLIVYAITRQPRWRGTLPELALWAFLLAALLSTVTSADPFASLVGALGRHEGLITVGAYAALYFVGVHFFGTRRGWYSFVVPAAAAAAVTIGYGLVQVFTPPLFAGEAFVREWYGRIGVPRIGSTLGGPLVFGGYLAFMLPMLLTLAAQSRTRIRVLWLAVAFVGVIDIALTVTRAAWVATIAGLAVFVGATSAAERQRLRGVIGGVAAVFVCSALILMTVVGTPSQLGARVASSIDTGSGSLAQHLYIWQRVARLIRLRPLLGWGLETLSAVFPYDRDSLVRYFGLQPVTVDRAHNDLLQVAVSVGVPGALAYVAFWILVAVAGVRLWRRQGGATRLHAAAWLGGLTAYLIQAQSSFSTVAITPVVWLMAGAVCGWEGNLKHGDDPPGAELDRAGHVTNGVRAKPDSVAVPALPASPPLPRG